jgi:hypothetical protein
MAAALRYLASAQTSQETRLRTAFPLLYHADSQKHVLSVSFY